MNYKQMILQLDEADTKIITVYYKLKQSGDEQIAAGKLFESSVKIQESIEIIDRLIEK